MDIESRLSALIERINQLPQLSSHEVEVRWGVRSTIAALDALEARLNIKLPRSFRQFQLWTGGGGIDTLAICSVPPDQPLGGIDTVFGSSEHFRSAWVKTKLPPHLVVIQRDLDDNEPFCLDTAKMREGECPVVLYYVSGYVQPIARNFIDFYENYTALYFEDS